MSRVFSSESTRLSSSTASSTTIATSAEVAQASDAAQAIVHIRPIDCSRPLEFLSPNWSPSSGLVRQGNEGVVLALYSFVSLGLSWILPTVAALVWLSLSQAFAGVALVATRTHPVSRIGIFTRKGLDAFGRNVFGAAYFPVLVVGAHLLLVASIIVMMVPSLKQGRTSMAQYFEIVNAEFRSSDPSGVNLDFSFSVAWVSLFLACGMLLTSGQEIKTQSNPATNAVADLETATHQEAEVLDQIITPAMLPPLEGRGRALFAACEIVAGFVSFSGLTYYLMVHGVRPYQFQTKFTVGIMASIAAWMIFHMCIVLTMNMARSLQHHTKAVRMLHAEPLSLDSVNPEVLTRWWLRRQRVVHAKLPMLYLQIGWHVALFAVAALISSTFALLYVLINKLGYREYNVQVTGFLALLCACAVILLLNMEVELYLCVQEAERTLAFLDFAVEAASHLPDRGDLPAFTPADKTAELSQFIAKLRASMQFDPFATVLGFPVKPAFRNLLTGYLLTALATLISQAGSN